MLYIGKIQEFRVIYRKLYKTVVTPAMMCGSDCMTTNKKEKLKIKVAEMRMLKWMCVANRIVEERNNDNIV